MASWRPDVRCGYNRATRQPVRRPAPQERSKRARRPHSQEPLDAHRRPGLVRGGRDGVRDRAAAGARAGALAPDPAPALRGDLPRVLLPRLLPARPEAHRADPRADRGSAALLELLQRLVLRPFARKDVLAPAPERLRSDT